MRPLSKSVQRVPVKGVGKRGLVVDFVALEGASHVHAYNWDTPGPFSGER